MRSRERRGVLRFFRRRSYAMAHAMQAAVMQLSPHSQCRWRRRARKQRLTSRLARLCLSALSSACRMAIAASTNRSQIRVVFAAQAVALIVNAH